MGAHHAAPNDATVVSLENEEHAFFLGGADRVVPPLKIILALLLGTFLITSSLLALVPSFLTSSDFCSPSLLPLDHLKLPILLTFAISHDSYLRVL